MSHTIPVVMYLRPNGNRAHGAVEVPAEFETPEKWTVIEAKLAELAAHGIAITQEEIPGDTVSVCLDNGEFDYKTALFPADQTYATRLTEFVMAFDLEDYHKVMQAYEDGEDMFGGTNG